MQRQSLGLRRKSVGLNQTVGKKLEGRDAISRFSPDSLQSSLTSKRLDYLTVQSGPSSCSGVINSRRSATIDDEEKINLSDDRRTFLSTPKGKKMKMTHSSVYLITAAHETELSTYPLCSKCATNRIAFSQSYSVAHSASSLVG